MALEQAFGAAESSALADASRLWEWFGLHSVPPGWDEVERAGPRVLVACACAPLDERGAAWLPPRLLRLAARRWATLLSVELRTRDNSLWRHALGERYESVRQRWLADGGDLSSLPAELEAAFVHSRTPARLA